MAVTRIMAMHLNKGRTIAQCLKDRTDYAKNPGKTMGGELISAFGCDPRTADAEFLFAKRQYRQFTGREPKNDVIAYQIRQSFKPGEVTPEEANRIGYELAKRFLKERHAFFVATHCDTAHIHNHIIFNSTSMDCRGKFRDFLGSGKAVARLSDLICLEHGLSVIENPKRGGTSYKSWLGDRARPSRRDLLRAAIDAALEEKPADFDTLLSLVSGAGYAVGQGRQITFRGAGQKQSIRLESLGKGYSEAELRAVIAGEKVHVPWKGRAANRPRNQLLIDIQARLRSGRGEGYRRWATTFNLKQMARTVAYLQEHHLMDASVLSARADEAAARCHALSGQIQAAQKHLAETAVLKRHIVNYARTREVYAAYRKSGYSAKYRLEHEDEIALHRAAKQAFDALGVQKLPSVKSLNAQYARLLGEKKAAYAEYRAAREEMRELMVHRKNLSLILQGDAKEGKGKEAEWEGR